MTWTDELAKKVPITLLLELKYLTKSQGAQRVAGLGLTPSDLDTVLEVCMPDTPAPSPVFDHRMFCAAAWQAGASYRQIARVVQLNPSTVYNHVNRWADTKQRLQSSLAQDRLERMPAIYQERSHRLSPGTTSSTIAGMLLFATLDNPPPPPIDYEE